jgi:hypothetical protein
MHGMQGIREKTDKKEKEGKGGASTDDRWLNGT